MSSHRWFLPALIATLVSCAVSTPIYRVKFSGNSIQVPVTSFENSHMSLVRDDQAAYDILLIQRSPLAYDAYLMKCTFDDHPLTTTTDAILCREDGSTYDFDGLVKNGPAAERLVQFPTETSDNLSDINQGMITINIQELGI